ncbi:CXXC motif containing zinc binding protein isoform X2 [Daktulosphaira vitifoliae]|uniref:CXXC motif containing zinc binding protein isoform X2 n=1 Tax=Daktulosphaira vitifoliae TaxID=58002 RepID=UPI0021A9CF53|nr:CXXC motif containing zinc binding protein isoform X2 [Daktulosphaira vitifoliae]
MVKISLQIKANLENVTDLIPEGRDFRWYLKFQCTNCGQESEKWIYLSEDEKVPIKGSRGEANLVTKCKMCSRESSVGKKHCNLSKKIYFFYLWLCIFLDIISESVSMYTVDDSNTFKTIVTFDCRGTSSIDFSPRNGFKCRGIESNTQFQDINLEEKEWVDYDEKEGQPVGIYDFEHQFINTK